MANGPILWPWWPVTAGVEVALVATSLATNAALNGRSRSLRVAVVTGSAAAVFVPIAVILASQDLRCDVTGFQARGDPGLVAILVMPAIGQVALAPLAEASGMPANAAWRMSAVASAAVLPAVLFESLVSLAGLNGYCAEQPALLQVHAAP